jgi:hypothetical protein
MRTQTNANTSAQCDVHKSVLVAPRAAKVKMKRVGDMKPNNMLVRQLMADV